MQSPDVDVVMTSNAALNRLDLEGMMAVYADDAVVTDHRRASLGSFSGRDQLRALYGGIIGSAAEFHEDVRLLAADGGLVVAECTVTAQLATDPTGATIGAEYSYVIAVRDGRIARLDLYDAPEDALEASGLATA